MSKFRVARPVLQIPLVHGASSTVATQAAAINGLVRQVIITTPAAVDATATITVDVLDQDSNVVYTKAALAVNTVTIDKLTMDLSVPLSGTQTVRVTFNAAQTVTDTVTKVTLVVDKG